MKTAYISIAFFLLLAVPAWPQTTSHTRQGRFKAVDRLTGEPLIVYITITCRRGTLGPGDDRAEAEITVYDMEGAVVDRNHDSSIRYCPTTRSEARILADQIDVILGPSSFNPPRAAAQAIPSPADDKVYMVNSTGPEGRSVIEVIDSRQRTFAGTIEIDDRLIAGMAVAPSGRRLYALLYPSSLGAPRPAYIAYIDTATNTITDRLELTGLFVPQTPALSPDGRYLYFAARAPETAPFRMHVADLQTKTVSVLPDPVPANTDLRAAAISPDGALLCASGTGVLSCYDTRTRTFLARAAVSPPNSNMSPVFHPNGRWIYLLGRSFVNGVLTIYISVVNTATLTETSRIPIVKPTAADFRDSVARLSIDPTGTRLILDERVNGVMNIIDTRTNRVVKTLEGLTTGSLGGAIITQ